MNNDDRRQLKRLLIIKKLIRINLELLRSKNIVEYSISVQKLVYLKFELDAINSTPFKWFNRNGQIDKRRRRRYSK